MQLKGLRSNVFRSAPGQNCRCGVEFFFSSRPKAQFAHSPKMQLLLEGTLTMSATAAAAAETSTPVITHRLSPRAFSTAVWALAQLPDPTKTLSTPVAKAARVKTVAALGAYAISCIPRLKAADMFHLLAGLHLLGFKVSGV